MALADFCHHFPAWMRGGWPLSWPHFVVGVRWIGRSEGLWTLRVAKGTRMGQADQKGWKDALATAETGLGLR